MRTVQEPGAVLASMTRACPLLPGPHIPPAIVVRSCEDIRKRTNTKDEKGKGTESVKLKWS